jgi:hypothetical protein
VAQPFSQIRVCSKYSKKERCCLSTLSEFISPSAVRSAIRREQGTKYGHRKDAEQESSKRKELRKRDEDDLAVSKVFA